MAAAAAASSEDSASEKLESGSCDAVIRAFQEK